MLTRKAAKTLEDCTLRLWDKFSDEEFQDDSWIDAQGMDNIQQEVNRLNKDQKKFSVPKGGKWDERRVRVHTQPRPAQGTRVPGPPGKPRPPGPPPSLDWKGTGAGTIGDQGRGGRSAERRKHGPPSSSQPKEPPRKSSRQGRSKSKDIKGPQDSTQEIQDHQRALSANEHFAAARDKNPIAFQEQRYHPPTGSRPQCQAR